MLRLLLGRSGTGKTDAILREIAADNSRPCLLIVPEQHSHDTERRLCAAAGPEVSLYGEVLSFTRLANRVFSVTGGLAAPALDAGGRLLLMYQAVRGTAPQLKVFRQPSRRPEFLTGLIATVDELKSAAVSPRALAEAAGEQDGAEGDKLADLALIYGAYEALTARQGADPRDRLTRLAAALAQSGWARGRRVYLDGFTDFTPQERQVIAVLLEQAEQVTAALTCDHLAEDEGGCGIFSPARRTAAQLIRLAGQGGTGWTHTVLAGPAGGRSPALAAVEAGLFDRGAAPIQGRPEGLSLFRARSPRSEAEWAAAQILRLVREEGWRFRDIYVGCRSMEGYGEVLETVFARYNIPLFLSRMEDILQKPVLTLITAALAAVAGDYRYEDVFRYLKTGLTGLAEEDRDLLENYVLKWDLRGSRWTARADWTMHPEGYGRPLRPEDQALLDRINAARRQVIAPLEGLRKNPDATGAGHTRALYRFLEEIDLPGRLAQRAELLHARGEDALAEEYRQLWDILCTAMEQCALILGDAPMELEAFSRLFALVLSQYDVGAIPVSLDRVTAGELPRLAHRHCRALFLLGADDASIPQAAPSPGLLNDDDRSLLASYGMELAPTLTDKLYRENTILYEACALPREHLSVSWAAAGSGGEEQRPSFLIRRLGALFPQLPVIDEGGLDGSFRLCAPRPALELAGAFPQAARALGAMPAWAPYVERMEAVRALERGRLSRGAVDALYGSRVAMSASRMDKLKACHFSYFMQYGLRARARKRAGFQAPEYGTFVHYVLEHVFRSDQWRGPSGGGGEGGLDYDALRALTRRAVEAYAARELGGLEGQSARFRYLFARLLRWVEQVVENVAQELAASDFRPVAFELGFGDREALPPVEIAQAGLTVSLSGFVDRVDGWVSGDKLYVKVTDYKTGKKRFDLTDVWNGLGLQLLVYLFTLKDKGRALWGEREIVPAGVFYLPARAVLVPGSRGITADELRRRRDAELRRSGLVLDDPEVLEAMEHTGAGGPRFLPVRVSPRTGKISGDALVSAQRLGRLERHIGRVLEEIAAELAAGDIAADPFWRGPERNACQWCDYAAACCFEEGRGGDRRRWLPTVRAEDFWRAVEGQADKL